MIELCAVGGYLSVGRNMTAIRYKDEAVILDMGLHLENYITYTEDEDVHDVGFQELSSAGAIPDISRIKNWIPQVKAILVSHAHLDHIGAIPFMAKKFDSAPILLTPYSAAVLEQISKDNDIPIQNKIRVLSDNSTYQLSKNITIEFINVTHSVPDSVMIAVHTPEGTVLYTGDYKFDETPLIGKTTNYERLRQLKNVKAVIMDSLYSGRDGRTPSEEDARMMLEKVLMGDVSKKNNVIVTTFSSHIARLKTIISIAKKMRRQVVFLGRSLAKYTAAAEDTGLVRFSDEVEIVKYSSKVKKRIKKMEADGKNKFVIVCTGHQAEKKAILSKMIRGGYYTFSKNDVVVFSCAVIPQEPNITNRQVLEDELSAKGVRVYKDMHVSGHASCEDQKMLIDMVKPKMVIPFHCERKQAETLKSFVNKWDSTVDVKIIGEGEFIVVE